MSLDTGHECYGFAPMGFVRTFADIVLDFVQLELVNGHDCNVKY